VIDRGIAFYKKIAPIIRDGYTYRFGPEILSYRHPIGWQGILRSGEYGDAFALFHVFDGDLENKYTINIPTEFEYEVEEVYSDGAVEIELQANKLSYKPTENRKAVAVYLKRNDCFV
ncbi:hypothetical protein CG709_19825, partial [Lachnotalea glycerini]